MRDQLIHSSLTCIPMINDTSEPKFAGLIFTAVYDYTGEMDYSSAILLLQIISMKVNELNLIF